MIWVDLTRTGGPSWCGLTFVPAPCFHIKDPNSFSSVLFDIRSKWTPLQLELHAFAMLFSSVRDSSIFFKQFLLCNKSLINQACGNHNERTSAFCLFCIDLVGTQSVLSRPPAVIFLMYGLLILLKKKSKDKLMWILFKKNKCFLCLKCTCYSHYYTAVVCCSQQCIMNLNPRNIIKQNVITSLPHDHHHHHHHHIFI